MVCPAAPALLLAMTLPLVGSPVARAFQPGPSQAGGESGQPLDQGSGTGESVLVSVYVQLDFSNKTWLRALSRNLTLPPASASFAPGTLTGFGLTTECDVKPDGSIHCACLSGYQWNASVCSRHHPCQATYYPRPCDCLVFSPPESGYCQLLPPGKYICCFEAQGFTWELYQVVRVPLQAADVAQLPDQLSVSCATSPGFQLSCCIPHTYLGYTASWSPGEGSEASLFNTPSDQCLVLSIQHCPAADTIYTCDLQSPGLTPLRVPVSVTIIQDGDTTCPEDSSAVAWNVTKAGHVAQAPCPVNRTGMVKRPCGPDGVWGPPHSSCTDTGLLALLQRAQLLWAGQGWPAEEVPQSLAQLLEQTAVVSSPSDLLALVGTMTFLAKVVSDTRIQLHRSALKGIFILLFGCLMDKKVQEALLKRFCRAQLPSSTISLATNETHILEHSKGKSENPSYEERMT
uniref:Adhesion G protein-coupled receptor F3 n=1 Tax=Molossus molossus TaxID=27622 RepID=A0A7J8E0L8_MOLMO|nr:adhesion G protein-coupled receptor F3 [Molossus molossus]